MKKQERNQADPPWNAGVEGDEVRRLINMDGEVIRVEAGPGTGKTFGLGRRVVRLLHPQGSGEDPKDVLVVAFNRVIARELRAEIEEQLKKVGLEELPRIQTVHALCLETIGEDLRLLLAHEREMMIYDVRARYEEIRQEYSSAQKADQALRNHEAGHENHVFLWQAVGEWLDEHRAALISDLPKRLLDHLLGGDFGGTRYRHVLVDEFQDLTAAEQELFQRMCAEDGQLLILGDSRQSIYAFRGNDPMGLRRLDEWAEKSGLELLDIPIRQCRRCPRTVVEAVNQLMNLSEADKMVPVRDEPAEIHLVYWRSPQSEAKGMAKRIVAHVRGTPPDERHLVMVTRRQFGSRLRQEIHSIDPDLNVDISFEEGILDSWPVREAFLFFCLMVDPDPPTWRAWLGYREPTEDKNWKPPERNAGAYRQFFVASGGKITTEAVEDLTSEQRTRSRGTGGTTLWDRATRFVELNDDFKDWQNHSPEDLIEGLFCDQRSPVLTGVDAEDASRLDVTILCSKALEILSELRDSGFAEEDLLPMVARQLRYKIATREPFGLKEGVDIQISTLWGAKGVTADHVYVQGLCDGAIPGERREEYPGTHAEYVREQRRLFYVSLTRAKKTLVLSRPKWIRPGDARKLGLVIRGMRNPTELLMSRFLREILGYLPEGVNGEDWEGPVIT